MLSRLSQLKINPSLYPHSLPRYKPSFLSTSTPSTTSPNVAFRQCRNNPICIQDNIAILGEQKTYDLHKNEMNKMSACCIERLDKSRKASEKVGIPGEYDLFIGYIVGYIFGACITISIWWEPTKK